MHGSKLGALPPTTGFFRAAASAVLTLARGCMLGNADITVVCERRKVGPHAEAMRAVLAEDLGVAIDAISVKATTTETLGFTGRGEGIAAHAVVLLMQH